MGAGAGTGGGRGGTRSGGGGNGAGLPGGDPLRNAAGKSVPRRALAHRARRSRAMAAAADRGDPPARHRTGRGGGAAARCRLRGRAGNHRGDGRHGLRLDRRCRSAPRPGARGLHQRQLHVDPVHPCARAAARPAGGSARPGVDARPFHLEQRRRGGRLHPDPLSRLGSRRRPGARAVAPDRLVRCRRRLVAAAGPARAGDRHCRDGVDGHTPAVDRPS